MKKRFMRRVLAAVSSMVLVLAMTSTVPVFADERTELENELKQLEQEEKKLKNQLASASEDLSASKERKELLDNQIGNVTGQIDLLSHQLDSIHASIEKKNKEIAKAEKEMAAKEAAISKTHQELGQRLRTIAKSGNLSAVQRLLNTDNYTDYLLKSKAAQCIAKRDQQTMDELEAALEVIAKEREKLQQQKTDIEKKKKDVEALKAKSDKKKKELDQLYRAARSEQHKLQSTIDGYNDDLKETQKKIDEANEAIEELIQNSGGSGSYNGNMMFWPVPTVRNISSHFGYRWGRMHRGIDISEGKIPIYGEKIYAAADGVVIAANYTSKWGSGWSYGYGYSCIIDHGEDSRGVTIATLYAHCSQMYARVGQKVVGGQTVIGRAGNTGDVTGPHLHFEVREDGKRVNPYPKYVHPNVN